MQKILIRRMRVVAADTLTYGIGQYKGLEDVGILTITGELDLVASTELRQVKDQATEYKTLAVDLQSVTYLDSEGIKWLCELKGKMKDNICLVISPGSQVERVLVITKLCGYFAIFHCYSDFEKLYKILGDDPGST